LQVLTGVACTFYRDSADMERRIALITGAAGGLGSSVARLLAAKGHDLVLVDVRREPLEKIGGELRKTGVRAETLPADLERSSECRRVVAHTVAALGKLDILINCAAVLDRTPPEKVTDASFERIFGINCHAVFYLCREAMADMATRNWGRIVNVTSTGVYEGGMNMTSALYEASKGAVSVFTKMFAKWGAQQGVLVNALCPGGMRTAMLLDATPAAVVQEVEARIPLGRLADPVEMAHAIVFLVSDEASYVCGATFDVNGGLVMP
jgi:NAD(P)-dependent dehydrogenase (short-subunit alcohol dehydrogenase family)